MAVNSLLPRWKETLVIPQWDSVKISTFGWCENNNKKKSKPITKDSNSSLTSLRPQMNLSSKKEENFLLVINNSGQQVSEGCLRPQWNCCFREFEEDKVKTPRFTVGEPVSPGLSPTGSLSVTYTISHSIFFMSFCSQHIQIHTIQAFISSSALLANEFLPPVSFPLKPPRLLEAVIPLQWTHSCPAFH